MSMYNKVQSNVYYSSVQSQDIDFCFIKLFDLVQVQYFNRS